MRPGVQKRLAKEIRDATRTPMSETGVYLISDDADAFHWTAVLAGPPVRTTCQLSKLYVAHGWRTLPLASPSGVRFASPAN